MIEHELLAMAEEKEKQSMWVEAFQLYNKIFIDVDCDEVLEKLAWCASRANLFDVSSKNYILLTQRQPSKAKWYYAVGYQHYMKKEWTIANEWFQKALKIYPDYFVVKYRLGYSLHQLCGTKQKLTKEEFWQSLKQYNECDVLFAKMTEENRKKNSATYAEICFQKGKLLVERNRTTEAIECFEKSLEMKHKDNLECEYQLAKALLENGNANKAFSILPKDASLYYVTELKADILVELGDLNKAKEILISHLLRRNKDYLHRKLAEIYLMQNQHKEALEEASKAISLNGKNHINHYLLSKIYFSIGLLHRAEKEAEKAIECKRAGYSSVYIEAKELLEKIKHVIIVENYLRDDESTLKGLFLNLTYKEINRLTGHIDIYYQDKGYGFIISESKKYFFHISSVPKELHDKIEKGLSLSFDEVIDEKGFAAKNIKVI